jgi:GGDEF domain-containing protein
VTPLRILAVGDVRVPEFGAQSAVGNDDMVLHRAADANAALQALAGPDAFDAVLVPRESAFAFGDAIEAISALAALVVVGPADREQQVHAIRLGAEDVISADELAMPGIGARLALAVERKRRADRHHALLASTDSATGLPNRQQFLEHLSQLAALREREPQPMAVVAVRVAGDAAAGGAESHVLKRKAAVRLRAGVRASDVVAWIGEDTYAVLLGALLAPTDAARVAAKLESVLAAPIVVGGRPVHVVATTAIAHHPADGTDATILLERAVERLAARTDRDVSSGRPAAANDA